MSARSSLQALAQPLRARASASTCRTCVSRPTPSRPSRIQARTLLTRRRASFWATSYPPMDEEHHVPPTLPMPPLPVPAPGSGVVAEPPTAESRSRRRERYLDSLMDKAGHMYLKCSILDANGNWTAEEGTYRKMDLCRAHDLDPRDLRKLDSLNMSTVPIILTRRSCILISIQHIRALIKPDRVIIFSTPGTEDNEAAKRFKAHLQANVRSGLAPRHEEREDGEDYGLPYEHRALESILVDTANALEEEMGFIRRLVDNLLEKFEHDIDRENLRRLLHYSRRLAGFQTRAKSIKSSFDELLDSDEDLSAMYVSDRMHGRPRAVHDHEQLELLLESFTKQVEEIISEIDTTVANMQSTQEVAELMLDSGRNALLALDIKVSMATLGIGAGALIPCLFGMNLTTNLENAPYAFYAASGASFSLAVLLYLYGSRVLKKVRHVSLVSKPSSLPQSVREAKERFVRERAEHWRWHEAQAAAECGEVAAAATARAQNGKVQPSSLYAKGIPDYEARWGAVRRSLRSRASLWDRIFRPHLLHRNLLGIKRATVVPVPRRHSPGPKPSSTGGGSATASAAHVPGGAGGAASASAAHVAGGATSPIPPSSTAPPSPMASPSRPTPRRTTSAPLARAVSTTSHPSSSVAVPHTKPSAPPQFPDTVPG